MYHFVMLQLLLAVIIRSVVLRMACIVHLLMCIVCDHG